MDDACADEYGEGEVHAGEEHVQAGAGEGIAYEREDNLDNCEDDGALSPGGHSEFVGDHRTQASSNAARGCGGFVFVCGHVTS